MNKNKIKKLAILLTVSVIITLVVSNISAFSMIGGEEKTIFEEDNINISEDNPLIIDNINIPIHSLEITTDSYNDFYTDVTVSFTDDNFSLKSGYDYNYCRQLVRSGTNAVNYFNISSYGNVGSIKIISNEAVNITSVRVNTGKPLSFSFILVLIIFVILYMSVNNIWSVKAGDRYNLIVGACGGVMCFLVIWFMAVICVQCDETLIRRIPLNVSGEDQYVQLFDAFHNHRTYLDIDFDSDELDSLANPYDRTQRNKANLHGDFWDRAYYNGKLYSYFGAAPVLTVYYPVYFVTRKIPTTLFASGILAIQCIIFISLLYGLFVKKFVGDVPAAALVLGQVAVIFGSGIFAAAAETMFYFMAVLSGVAWTAAFLYFLFKAYYTDSLKSRVILLICCGISGSLIAASRPTLLLYCAVGLIPAFGIMTSESESIKNKAIYCASVGVPLFIGACLIMAYNNTRFDNPFEFGFNYQLTVSRAQANTIKLSMIPPAVYHYFLQQPNVTSSFPYIRLASRGWDSYTRYSYAGRTMGIMTYPAAWGIAVLPMFINKKDIFRSVVLSSLGICALLMSFIDMCKAGSHYRYTIDIGFAVLLLSVIGALMLLNKLSSNESQMYKYVYFIMTAAVIATVIIGVLLIFANESERIISDYPKSVEVFRNMV